MIKKEDIVQFKANNGSYIGNSTNITPHNVYYAFYGSDNDKTNLGITYCSPSVYEVSRGDFNCGIKYSIGGENYYMFIGANSGYAPAQSISVGKAKDGLIYLIWEDFPNPDSHMQLRIISEEYVLKNEPGFRPRSYRNTIFAYGNLEDKIKKLSEKITDEDVKCVEVASEGIVVFSDLIGSMISKTNESQADGVVVKVKK